MCGAAAASQASSSTRLSGPAPTEVRKPRSATGAFVVDETFLRTRRPSSGCSRAFSRAGVDRRPPRRRPLSPAGSYRTVPVVRGGGRRPLTPPQNLRGKFPATMSRIRTLLLHAAEVVRRPRLRTPGVTLAPRRPMPSSRFASRPRSTHRLPGPGRAPEAPSVSRTLKEVLCRRPLEAVLCERWRTAGPPASAYGGRR